MSRSKRKSQIWNLWLPHQYHTSCSVVKLLLNFPNSFNRFTYKMEKTRTLTENGSISMLSMMPPPPPVTSFPEIIVSADDLPCSSIIKSSTGPYTNKTFLFSFNANNPEHTWMFGRKRITKKSKKSKKTTRFCLELDPSVSGNHLEVLLKNDGWQLEMSLFPFPSYFNIIFPNF